MTAARLSRLGLRLGPLGAPTLVASFAPPRPRVGALVLIPHGRTPSNQRLIFQNHSEGPDATLLPESLVEAGKGAEVFLDAFGDRLERCSFRRSPLHRCAQTWEAYTAVLADRGLEVPEMMVDKALVEIDHASWHGKTVEDLEGADRAAAAAHRAGDCLAKPPDGESCAARRARTRCRLGRGPRRARPRRRRLRPRHDAERDRGRPADVRRSAAGRGLHARAGQVPSQARVPARRVRRRRWGAGSARVASRVCVLRSS